jgi:hypothetical protein
VEKTTPADNHRHLLNIYGDQAVDVNTVGQWLVHLNSDNSDVRDRSHSGQLCTAVSEMKSTSISITVEIGGQTMNSDHYIVTLS